MADERVKVVGYAQRTFFDNGIEYRNFADNLVGNQIIEEDGSALFTMGNFKVTTNNDPKANRIFKTKKFGNFVTLNDLDLTCDEVNVLLKNNAEVKLKLDRSNLCNYAFFGSTQEYVRVTLENIISTWPASLYMDPNVITTSSTGHTMQDYTYSNTRNEATFSINTSTINNKFDINFLANGSTIDTFNEGNDLRNLTVNYANYVVFVDGVEYPIVTYTGPTSITNDLLTITVDGDPFTGTSSFRTYHIKPKSIKVEEFFNGLGDLENYLLDRMIIPKYSAKFRFPTITDTGVITFKDTVVQWPVSDGYNIDFDTTKYIDYVSELLKIATNSDLSKSNLIVRFLTSDSISEFDTLPNCDGGEEETAGQKMNKTLKVYGREFDEIKRHIDGIQWANTVTYDQKNNTPDVVLKNLARTLGWDIISSVLENDLLKSYVEPKETTFDGHSRGLTPIEAEHELWRRLVLNSAWLWKSKGTRKAVEFLFKFIGAPNGLMSFNEYVYKTSNKIDVEQFKQILDLQGNDEDITKYSLDSEGYPRAKANTPELYFQKGGLWWRETGGSNASINILKGNNPHVGPYDGGNEYMQQFNLLIPNFSAVTITEQTITTGDTNIFINYNSGFVNGFAPVGETDAVYIDILDDENVAVDTIEITTDVIDDPFPSAEMTDCGCETGEEDHSIRINIKKIEQSTCLEVSDTVLGDFITTFDNNEWFEVLDVSNGTPVGGTSITNAECCTLIGGRPTVINGRQICLKTSPPPCGTFDEYILASLILGNPAGPQVNTLQDISRISWSISSTDGIHSQSVNYHLKDFSYEVTHATGNFSDWTFRDVPNTILSNNNKTISFNGDTNNFGLIGDNNTTNTDGVGSVMISPLNGHLLNDYIIIVGTIIDNTCDVSIEIKAQLGYGNIPANLLINGNKSGLISKTNI